MVPRIVPAAEELPSREVPHLVTVRRLEVGHRGSAILPPIDLEVDPGSFWAIIGPNGSGKTTFVRTLLGLQAPVRGVLSRAPHLRPAYVPQQAELDPVFPIKVLDFVLMGRLRRGNLLGPRRRSDLDAARAALDEVKAAALAPLLLRDLSGGQRQRVLVARALSAEANLLVLDEPTAALDLATEREVLELLGQLRRHRQAALVMVTHLVEDGLERADRALLLDRDHGVARVGSTREIAASPELGRLYGPLLSRREQPR
jgi:ABC-type Mn2+/Zn2+ transport system ATPase subunit